ncbi:MAG: hypothetical protein HY399_04515, partial [Elusimicrobia bacterium]|nr:hypothetical protein [Elusimicrobiota bacterium]
MRDLKRIIGSFGLSLALVVTAPGLGFYHALAQVGHAGVGAQRGYRGASWVVSPDIRNIVPRVSRDVLKIPADGAPRGTVGPRSSAERIGENPVGITIPSSRTPTPTLAASRIRGQAHPRASASAGKRVRGQVFALPHQGGGINMGRVLPAVSVLRSMVPKRTGEGRAEGFASSRFDGISKSNSADANDLPVSSEGSMQVMNSGMGPGGPPGGILGPGEPRIPTERFSSGNNPSGPGGPLGPGPNSPQPLGSKKAEVIVEVPPETAQRLGVDFMSLGIESAPQPQKNRFRSFLKGLMGQAEVVSSLGRSLTQADIFSFSESLGLPSDQIQQTYSATPKWVVRKTNTVVYEVDPANLEKMVGDLNARGFIAREGRVYFVPRPIQSDDLSKAGMVLLSEVAKVVGADLLIAEIEKVLGKPK